MAVVVKVFLLAHRNTFDVCCVTKIFSNIRIIQERTGCKLSPKKSVPVNSVLDERQVEYRYFSDTLFFFNVIEWTITCFYQTLS